MPIEFQSSAESLTLSPEMLREMAEWRVLEEKPLMEGVRLGVVDRVRHTLGDSSIMGSVRESWRRNNQALIDWNLSALQSAHQRGDLVLSHEGGAPVSFVILKPLRNVGENPHLSGSVVELGRAFTKPEFRGRGFYREVRNKAIALAKEKYPEAALITTTHNERVKAMNRHDGWTEISYADFLQIYNDVPEDREGWTAFYLSWDKNNQSREDEHSGGHDH